MIIKSKIAQIISYFNIHFSVIQNVMIANVIYFGVPESISLYRCFKGEGAVMLQCLKK